MTRLRLAMTYAELAEPNLAEELQTHEDFCQFILDGDIAGAKDNLTRRLGISVLRQVLARGPSSSPAS